MEIRAKFSSLHQAAQLATSFIWSSNMFKVASFYLTYASWSEQMAASEKRAVVSSSANFWTPWSICILETSLIETSNSRMF